MKYIEIILTILTIGVVAAHLRINRLTNIVFDAVDQFNIVANRIKAYFNKLNKQSDDKE